MINLLQLLLKARLLALPRNHLQMMPLAQKLHVELPQSHLDIALGYGWGASKQSSSSSSNSTPEVKAKLLLAMACDSETVKSTFDQFWTTKRRISRSPYPEKSAKRKKRSPLNEQKITSRLDPTPIQPAKEVATVTQVHTSLANPDGPSTFPLPRQGGPKHGCYQPQACPVHLNHEYAANKGMPRTTAPLPYEQPNYTSKQCVHSPSCEQGDCMLNHPTRNCPSGGECLDIECLFIHKMDIEAGMCNYDAKCTRENCVYEHRERRFVVGNPCGYVAVECSGECPGQSYVKVHKGDIIPHQKAQVDCSVDYCNLRKNKAKKEVADLVNSFQSLMIDDEE